MTRKALTGGTRDGGRVRRVLRIEAKRTRYARCHGVRALGRVIKPASAHRCLVGEAALHLVSDCQSRQVLPAGHIGVLGRGQHGCQVVAGMTRLAGGEIGVVEVQVSDQRTVPQRRPVGGSAPIRDAGNELVTAEVVQLLDEHLDRLAIQGANSAAERIQHPHLQLPDGILGQLRPGRLHREPGEPIDDRHRNFLSPRALHPGVNGDRQ